MKVPWIGLGISIGSCCVVGCAAPKRAENVTAHAGQPVPQPQTSSAKPSPATRCDDLTAETVTNTTPDGVWTTEQGVWDGDKNFVLHGTTTHFWPDGNKKLELGYRCGVKHGPKRAWYPDGQPWNSGAFLDGKGHGVWTEWFPSGVKSQEFTLDHGAWNGMQTSWHQNGKKKMQVAWVNGQRQGPFTIWDDVGNALKRVDFVDGNPQPTPERLVRSARTAQ